MRVGTAGSALSGGETMRRDMTVNRALRHPSVHFSTTWAQNQPLAEIVGHGLQFDLSAVKKERRGRIPRLNGRGGVGCLRHRLNHIISSTDTSRRVPRISLAANQQSNKFFASIPSALDTV